MAQEIKLGMGSAKRSLFNRGRDIDAIVDGATKGKPKKKKPKKQKSSSYSGSSRRVTLRG